MPPPGHEHDLDPRRMRPPQRDQIALRNLKLWIEQRAVDIGRQQPDGRLEKSSPLNFTIRTKRAISSA